MPVGQLLPELVVLLTAVAVLLTAMALPRERQWLCAVMALSGLAAATVAAVFQLDSPAHLTFQGVWAVDGVAVWAKLLIFTAAAATVLMAPEWLHGDARHGEYYVVLLFATLAAVLMAGAADTMQLVIAVLLSSVTGYTLAAYHRDWPLSVEAGMKYFIVGALANALLLVGVVWLFGLAASTDYRTIATAVADTDGGSGWLVAAALVMVGLAFKLGAVPAHAWMPDVAQGAPAPSAAFLTVVPKIGAAVALARLGGVLAPAMPAWTMMVALLAVITMTLGNLAALPQRDLRRLLGWSSVSQSGYALAAVALVGITAQAGAALLFFLAGYAAANLAAFAVVTELRGRTALEDYRGLAAARPGLFAALALALLSLVGVPPLAGFVGKALVMLEAVRGDYVWLAGAIVANTVVSLYYYLRVLGPGYFDRAPAVAPLLGRSALAAVLATTAAVVVLGLGAEWLLGALQTAGWVALHP